MASPNQNHNSIVSRYSLFQLKLEREQKEEKLRSLQRNHNYKMRILSKKWKQKMQIAEKQRKRDQFLSQKRNFSHQILRLKRQSDRNVQKKNACLKESVEFHRQQKIQNATFMTQGIINEANIQRFQKTFYHLSMQRQKKSSYFHKRRLYQRQRKRQTQKKNRQQLKREQMRAISKSCLEQRIITEYQRLQETQYQYNVKKELFNNKIRYAVDEYNRLSLN